MGPKADNIEEVIPSEETRKSAASSVAAGIFASRITGFLREAVIAFFFGVTAHSDVLQASFRAPNLLQNLLGEGTISAAFIPVYSRLLAEGRAEEAGRFAGAILSILVVVVSAIVLLGIALARPLVTILVPGYMNDAAAVAAGELSIDRFEMIVSAVRIIFPMTGMLVLSAWALGVLNSHRRFLTPYFAPVLWNVAQIAALFAGAYLLTRNILAPENGLSIATLNSLLFYAFWGALVGGVLQFAVQLPQVARLMKGFRLSLSTRVTGVKESLRAFGPVVAGRGVYQISAYLDTFLASWLGLGALASLRFAQMFYMLPVSLFGLSVAASELPELSRLREEHLRTFMDRIERSMRQSLFMVIPTIVGYLVFGFLIVGGFFRRGNFELADTWLVYLVLAGYSLGLAATTISRLLQNAFYAIGDTKTPAKVAVVRVVASTAVAIPAMFWLNQFSVSGTLGFEPGDSVLYLGAVGLAFGASVGAWLEFGQLVLSLRKRLTFFALPGKPILAMLAIALAACLPAALFWYLLQGLPQILLAIVIVAIYGGSYLLIAWMTGLEEINAWLGRLVHRFQRTKR